MRKQIIDRAPQKPSPADPSWLDLARLARVEITSEQADHPIEAALSHGSGWRADQPGEQTIRLLFDSPIRLRHIRLRYEETQQERTQEFVLRWSRDGGESYQEILRQQFHFSPPGTAVEAEDYEVDLQSVTALELKIIPNISGGAARASLAQLRVA
jgi:hypothetical protein